MAAHATVGGGVIINKQESIDTTAQNKKPQFEICGFSLNVTA